MLPFSWYEGNTLTRQPSDCSKAWDLCCVVLTGSLCECFFFFFFPETTDCLFLRTSIQVLRGLGWRHNFWRNFTVVFSSHYKSTSNSTFHSRICGPRIRTSSPQGCTVGCFSLTCPLRARHQLSARTSHWPPPWRPRHLISCLLPPPVLEHRELHPPPAPAPAAPAGEMHPLLGWSLGGSLSPGSASMIEWTPGREWPGHSLLSG